MLVLAILADFSDQTLSQNRIDRRADQIRLDADVDQSRDRCRGVIGVQRAEHEVAGQCRLDRDVRRFGVANFAEHHHVRVLTQQAAKRRREGHAELVMDLYLRGRAQVIFDGILNRADVQLRRVHAAQR